MPYGTLALGFHSSALAMCTDNTDTVTCLQVMHYIIHFLPPPPLWNSTYSLPQSKITMEVSDELPTPLRGNVEKGAQCTRAAPPQLFSIRTRRTPDISCL